MNDDRHFRLGNTALYARDRRRLTSFYQTMFGMKVIADEESSEVSLLAFEQNASHHDLSVVGNPRSVQMGVNANSLFVLKELWHKIIAQGIPVRGPYVEQRGVSFQFHDPEGNRIEVTCPPNLTNGSETVRPSHPEPPHDPADIWQWVREQAEP